MHRQVCMALLVAIKTVGVCLCHMVLACMWPLRLPHTFRKTHKVYSPAAACVPWTSKALCSVFSCHQYPTTSHEGPHRSSCLKSDIRRARPRERPGLQLWSVYDCCPCIKARGSITLPSCTNAFALTEAFPPQLEVWHTTFARAGQQWHTTSRTETAGTMMYQCTHLG